MRVGSRVQTRQGPATVVGPDPAIPHQTVVKLDSGPIITVDTRTDPLGARPARLMGYLLDLDEHTEERLAGELAARERDRARGVCDYCHRRPTTRPCRYIERHTDARIAASTPCTTCNGTGAGTVGYGYCGPCDGRGVAR